MTPDVVDLNGLALALVTLMHSDDRDTFTDMAVNLSPADLAGVCVILSMWVDEAWGELCDRDGSTFDEFVQSTGLWLAGGDV